MQTFATMISHIDRLKHQDRLRVSVAFNLAGLMRQHQVTIRQLADYLQVTLKRVREVRGMSAVPYLVALDYLEAVEAIARAQVSAPECPECGGSITHVPDGQVAVPSLPVVDGFVPAGAAAVYITKPARFDSCNRCDWAGNEVVVLR